MIVDIISIYFLAVNTFNYFQFLIPVFWSISLLPGPVIIAVDITLLQRNLIKSNFTFALGKQFNVPVFYGLKSPSIFPLLP